MKLRMIAGMLLVMLLSFGVSTSAEAHGRHCCARHGCGYRPHGFHGYHRGHGCYDHGGYRGCGGSHGGYRSCR